MAGCLGGLGGNKQVNVEEVVKDLLALNVSEYPSLDDEELGMLKFMYERALLPIDDVSEFDVKTHPFAGFGHDVRYDCTFSSHAVAMAAEKTPAYREIYQSCIDNFTKRLIDKQAWKDWTEGTTGNDGSVIPYSPDPVAVANIMYSGYFGSVPGLYELISNDYKYDSGFALIYNESLQFTYDYKSIVEIIHRQMKENMYGCYGVPCEPHFVFYICNMLGCAALQLYDKTHGTNYAEVVNDEWLDWVGENFIVPPRKTGLPILWVHVAYVWKAGVFFDYLMAETNLLSAAYTSPFDEILAKDLYDYTKTVYGRYDPDGTAYFVQAAGISNTFWKYMSFSVPDLVTVVDPDGTVIYFPSSIVAADAEATISGLLASKEVNDMDMYEKVLAYINQNYQPTWDNGTFYYRLYYSNESGYNNGMANALIMLAKVMPPHGIHDMWTGEMNGSRFSEPTLCGVDPKAVRVSTAFFDSEKSALVLRLNASDESQEASFAVSNLGPKHDVILIEDGELRETLRAGADGKIKLSADGGWHTYIIRQL